MKLAFIIPAYNEEALIAGCIKSVLEDIKRTGCEAEVVVVNNASTDRTGEIARGFDGITVVDEPEKGLVHARHAGLMASSAELVANLDADTMVPPGWTKTVLDAFAKDDGLVGLSGPFIYYDLPAYRRFLVRFFYTGAYVIYWFNKHVLKVGAMIQGGNFVFRRSVWLKVGGYDRSIAFYGEDTDVARRLAPAGRVLWTFRLPMYASGRRLKAEGMLTIALRYAINYFWVTFRGKPYSQSYTDVRPDDEGDLRTVASSGPQE